MKNKKKPTKKDVRGASINKKAVVLITLAAVVVIAAAGLLTLFFCGFRYMKITYRSKITSEEQKISFLGFVDASGAIRSGRLTYDAKRATAAKNEKGTYTLTYSNGDVYEGEMDGLQRQGRGVMLYAGGDRYEGTFAGDKFDGTGVYEYAGGDRYEGSFSAGKKSGEGHYVWMTDGEITAEYTGSFKNDRREGKGVFKSSDGAVYSGLFVNDMRQDESAEVLIPSLSGGTDRYFGAYKNDVRSGYGYYYYAGGNVYVGGFENNKPEGEGLICFADGGGYKGIFKDGNLLKEGAVELTPEEVQKYLEGFNSSVNPLTNETAGLTP